MDLAVVVLAVGLALAVLGAAGIAWTASQARRGDEEPPEREPELPEGVHEVLAVLRSAVVVVDMSERVVKATPAAHAFGLVRDGHLAHPEVVDLVRQVRRDGRIEDREMELARSEHAEPLLLDIRVAPLGPLHVLVLLNDRTEARRVEEARRDFVANVSHELKTPVGAISLLAETLMEAADDPDVVRRFASRLATESERLSQLVQEIIDLSRLQAMHGVQSPTTVAIDAVVSEAVDRSRLSAEAKNITIDVGGVRGCQVRGDHGLIVTAVRNLVDNAIRYSDNNTQVGVGISTDDTMVLIAVADEGIGIPAAERERVFERFYRIDQARSRATGGTGLGLSIVKHIAANHGGDVRLWSHPGSGSTFTLRLPMLGMLAPRPVPPRADEPATGDDPPADQSSRRITA